MRERKREREREREREKERETSLFLNKLLHRKAKKLT